MISSPNEKRVACFVYDLVTGAAIDELTMDRYTQAAVQQARELIWVRPLDFDGFLDRWYRAYNPTKVPPTSYDPVPAVKDAASKLYAIMTKDPSVTPVNALVATPIETVVGCSDDPVIRAALSFIRMMFGFIYADNSPSKYRARAVFHSINSILNLTHPLYLCDKEGMLTNPLAFTIDAETNRALWLAVFQTDMFNGFHNVDISARQIIRMPARYKALIDSLRSEV
jgi:hypothetical protein